MRVIGDCGRSGVFKKNLSTFANAHLLNGAAVVFGFSGIFWLCKCIRRGEFACRWIEMIVTLREHIDCASWVRRVEQKTMEEEERERRRKNCWSMVDDTTGRTHTHTHTHTHTTIQPWAWLLSPCKYTWRQFSKSYVYLYIEGICPSNNNVKGWKGILCVWLVNYV